VTIRILAAAVVVALTALLVADVALWPATVTPAVVPSPYGTPVTACADGSWPTAAGPGACSQRGGMRRG
jgi:hypothetical protein